MKIVFLSFSFQPNGPNLQVMRGLMLNKVSKNYNYCFNDY